jgi:hypothetical protein
MFQKFKIYLSSFNLFPIEQPHLLHGSLAQLVFHGVPQDTTLLVHLQSIDVNHLDDVIEDRRRPIRIQLQFSRVDQIHDLQNKRVIYDVTKGFLRSPP